MFLIDGCRHFVLDGFGNFVHKMGANTLCIRRAWEICPGLAQKSCLPRTGAEIWVISWKRRFGSFRFPDCPRNLVVPLLEGVGIVSTRRVRNFCLLDCAGILVIRWVWKFVHCRLAQKFVYWTGAGILSIRRARGIRLTCGFVHLCKAPDKPSKICEFRPHRNL